MYKIWIGLLALLISGAAAAKSEIYIVDGDSLFIGKREVRLSGIDAPEYMQECFDAKKQSYRCGLKAREALIAMTDESLECKEVARDRYKRYVSVCYVQGKDINRQMVRQGFAVAYDRYAQDYVSAEQEAKAAKRGIWQGRFMRPEFYRDLKRE